MTSVDNPTPSRFGKTPDVPEGKRGIPVGVAPAAKPPLPSITARNAGVPEMSLGAAFVLGALQGDARQNQHLLQVRKSLMLESANATQSKQACMHA